MDERVPRSRRLRTGVPAPAPLPEHVLLVGIDDPLERVFWRASRDMSEWIASPQPTRASEPGDVELFREQLACAVSKTPELEEAFGAFGLLRLNPKLAKAYRPSVPGRFGARAASAPWQLIRGGAGISQDVRLVAAVDLAHAARSQWGLPGVHARKA